MLRSLDPHSNYYDRDEYEELKTDQRSEYFGIGASIQNYLLGPEARHVYYRYVSRFARVASRTALWGSNPGCRWREDDGQGVVGSARQDSWAAWVYRKDNC